MYVANAKTNANGQANVKLQGVPRRGFTCDGNWFFRSIFCGINVTRYLVGTAHSLMILVTCRATLFQFFQELTMTRPHDFVVDLARAGPSASTIFTLCEAVHGNKALSLSQVYHVMTNVKDGKMLQTRGTKTPRGRRGQVTWWRLWRPTWKRTCAWPQRRSPWHSRCPTALLETSCMMIYTLSNVLHAGFQSSWQMHTKLSESDVHLPPWSPISISARPSWKPSSPWTGPMCPSTPLRGSKPVSSASPRVPEPL